MSDVTDIPAAWNKGGLQSADGFKYNREGTALISVNGRTMWELKGGKKPVKWDISLIGDKCNIKQMRFYPHDLLCFGTGNSGCDFEWKDVFAGNSIIRSSEKVCSANATGSSSVTYKISVDGKQDALVTYYGTGGSGGTTNWVDLRWETNDIKLACSDIQRELNGENN